MTTLTVDFWIKHFPAEVTMDAIHNLTGLGAMPMAKGLLWLADRTEQQWKPRWNDNCLPWKKPGSKYGHENDYHVSAGALSYKPTFNYLTLEGLPLGTKGWYIAIEHGVRQYAIGSVPHIATLRAVVLMEVEIRRREIAPSLRLPLEVDLKEVSVQAGGPKHHTRVGSSWEPA